MEPHPIRLVVADDLERSRLTVGFRALLAIPHLFWLVLWGFGVLLLLVIAWFWTLVAGRVSDSLWELLASYVRYVTHVYAFLFLAANPFPGFLGVAGTYPVDLEIDPPQPQNRWKTAFRGVLAIPALLVSGALMGSATSTWNPVGPYVELVGASAAGGGVAGAVAFLGWFAALAQARSPRGFRDLLGVALRYGAQTNGFLLFVTDRYPDADPASAFAAVPPARPVELVSRDDDLRRARLIVFFRYLLAFPHFFWLTLWGIAATIVLLLGWIAALATGRLPRAFHRFLAAYLRYEIHVLAFVSLVANPFPGFAGTAGAYPVDVRIDPLEPQGRLNVLFRGVLGVPALILATVLSGVLWLVAFLSWWVALLLGRMPRGLRALAAFSLGYQAQVYGYLSLLTSTYPYSGPPATVPESEEEAAPAWPVAPLSPFF